jgi:hypothetical protein
MVPLNKKLSFSGDTSRLTHMHNLSQATPGTAVNEQYHAYPWWSPRFWHGMPLSVWGQLLREQNCRVSPSRLGLLGTISMAAAFNTVAGWFTEARYARQLKTADVRDDPVFIVGHWRSGTTLLHELMMLDGRFFCPSTFQCFAAGHFLLTESLLTRWLAWMMPTKRPMDNVAAGWDRPQEDEFALMNLGAPSPYRRMAFPHTASNEPVALDVQMLDAAELSNWQATFHRFLRMLAVRDARRTVLKSPPHTARMGILREMFPNARFLHIVRNPLVVFPSTIRLWKSLDFVQGLQVDRGERLEQYVLESFRVMYEAFERDRVSVPDACLHELKYEDLVEDPVGQLENAYRALELGEFHNMRPALEKQAAEMRDYRRNRYTISESKREMLLERWQPFFDRYGYRADVTEGASAG